MTKYDIIYEKVNELYKNGSLTFEEASRINDLAYEKYITEGSMTRFRDAVLKKDEEAKDLYNKYANTPLLKIKKRKELRDQYNDEYNSYLKMNSKYKNMTGSDAIISKTMEDELKRLKKFGNTQRVKDIMKDLSEDKQRFVKSINAHENCVLEDKSDILADIYDKLESNKGVHCKSTFRNPPKRPLIKHNEENKLEMSDEDLRRLRMYDHNNKSTRASLFSHIGGRIGKDDADKLNNQLAEMNKEYYDARVKSREDKIAKKEIH